MATTVLVNGMQQTVRTENVAFVHDVKKNSLLVRWLRKKACKAILESNLSCPEEGNVSLIDKTSGQTILNGMKSEFGVYELLVKPQADTTIMESKSWWPLCLIVKQD